LFGESSSADIVTINLSLPHIICTTDHYSLCNIYNIDETGLFYSIAPDCTIMSCQVEGSKKDKLQGMRWAKIAWNEVTVETIKNCWAYTKIISSHDESGMSIVSKSGNVSMKENLVEENIECVEENLNKELIDDLQRQIVALHVRTPISVKNWLNPEGEEDMHQQFIDDDFVQSAIEVEQKEEKEVVEPSLTPKEN
ncbi:5375_t:CDS:2, partial [Dentiscutata heterogama]